jgi:hypothetical protein
MTPYKCDVLAFKSNNTSIRLANHSLVSATHKGIVTLALDIKTSVPALVVPDLHEPLLLVAGMCDQGLSVLFNSASCKIFRSSDLDRSGEPVGRGYRKGNLYYLPAPEVTQSSLALSVPSVVDTSLLGYHLRLSHIGLRPLKKLLATLKVKPTVMNEINV